MNLDENDPSRKQQSPLNIESYIGRDLRLLPEEEIQQILTLYNTLRNTYEGYLLGHKVNDLQILRAVAPHDPTLQAILEDNDRWIFRGSKARQEKEKKNKSTPPA